MASVSCAQGNEEAEFMFAKKAFSDGFYALAQENFEDFLDKYPGNRHLYEVHFLLGRCFYYQNNLKMSSYEFDMALNAPAGAFQDAALYWMGDIYYRSGDFKKALEFYQKVIDEYPASKYLIYALYSKAWAYYRLGFEEDSRLAFGDVISRYPLENLAIESHFKIGECEYLLGQYNEAQDSLKRFIERYPISEKIAQAHYIIGDIKIRQAQYEDGINFLNRSLSISPEAEWAPYAFYRAAEAYFKIGNYDESIKRFDWCIKRSGNDFLASNSLLGLARNYYEKGMTRDALRSCDEVTAAFPRTDAAAEGYYIKANILNSEKRYKEAIEVCLKGIDRFLVKRQTGKLHYELGWIYLKEGRPKDALSEFLSAEEFLDNTALISSALCKIGDIYFDLNYLDKAAWAYEAVLKKYPDSPWYDYAQLRIANIFLETKKYDQAVLAYQSILANFPSTKLNTEVMFNLGVAYFNKKDFHNASSEFKKLIWLSPKDPKGPIYKLYLANSLYNINRYEDALDLFKWLAKNAKDNQIALKSQYQIAWCYYRLNRDMEAVDSFNTFLKKYPDSAFNRDALDISAAILSSAAQNFEKWKMPNDAVRLYEKLAVMGIEESELAKKRLEELKSNLNR